MYSSKYLLTFQAELKSTFDSGRIDVSIYSVLLDAQERNQDFC